MVETDRVSQQCDSRDLDTISKQLPHQDFHDHAIRQRIGEVCAGVGLRQLEKEEQCADRNSVTYHDSRANAQPPLDRAQRTLNNIEGNVHTPLLGEDLDSSIPPWQHDDSRVRVPARIILWLGRFIVRNCLVLLFTVILVVCGVVLAISTRQGHISVLPLWFFAMGSVGLTIAARFRWG